MINSYTHEFKCASIGLLLSIIHNVNPKNTNKYYKFFQKELNINRDEFEEILELKEFKKSHNIAIENNIDVILEELEYKRHQIMKFVMILNRCIIIDGCDIKSYQQFEKIRDSFIKKI